MISRRDQIRNSNRSDVIDALYSYGECSVKELTRLINSDRKSRGVAQICTKTVLRGLKDPRVVKNKTHYKINDNAHNEIRYRKPELFRDDILRAAFQNFPSRFKVDTKKSSVSQVDPSKIMNEYIKRFGALIIFAFIEAARPFEDNSMSIRERGYLVTDWISNAIPLQEMFHYFRAEFAPTKAHRRNKSSNEIESSQINYIFEIFKKTNPDICKNLIHETQMHRKE